MKDRIKEAIAGRGVYTLDLYRKLKYKGSFHAFELLLNAGVERGDWICHNGLWQLLNSTEPTVEPKVSRFQGVDALNIVAIPLEHRLALEALTYAPDGWSHEMLPCLFTEHEHDGWYSRQNGMGVFRHTDGRGFTFSCFKCSENRTFRVKPKRAGNRRVKQVSDSEAVYQALESAQVENMKFWDYINAPRNFSTARRAYLIDSDTGTGKDYTMMIEASRNDVMSLNPHTGLSDQMHERSIASGRHSFRMKSRMHGFAEIVDLPMPQRIAEFKRNPEVMCVHADRCHALIARTGSCKEVLCNADGCEVYDFCSDARYISQIQKAAGCEIVHWSWPQLPTDPAAKGIVAQFEKARKKAGRSRASTYVVGEVDALKLLNTHRVSVAEIRKGVETWGDAPAGQLYQLLGDLTATHLTGAERFAILLDRFHQIPFKAASRQLARIGVQGLGQTEELTLANALKHNAVRIETVSDIEALPRLYAQEWTLMHQIEQFLTYCANPDPPIFFDTRFLWFITPPDLNKQIDTYVMQSATANASQIEGLLQLTGSDISFHGGASARVSHHPEARIFKVATGRYVRSTCFTYDDTYNSVTGIRDEIRPHLEILLSILTNTPGAKHVNTYKALYESDVLAGDPLIDMLRSLPDVTWSNWATSYGLDFDEDTVLIEFGTNEPSLYLLQQTCQAIYFHDAEPLIYDYENYRLHDGVRIEGVRTYTDPRVQAVYEQISDMAQYQVANRTRPIRNATRVLIYSSHPCKWLDSRVQWVLPTMLGTDLRTFEVEAEVSEFQAKRSEKQALAIELAKEGLTNAEIARQLNYKSRSSVANLLKDAVF